MASATFSADSFGELLDKITEYLNDKSKNDLYTQSNHSQNRNSKNGKINNIKTEKDGISAINKIIVPYSAPDCSKLYTVENDSNILTKSGVKTSIIRVLAPLADKSSIKVTFKEGKDKTRVTLTYKNMLEKMFHGANFSSFSMDEDVQIVFDGSDGEKFDKKHVKLDYESGIIKITLRTLLPKDDNDVTVFTLN